MRNKFAFALVGLLAGILIGVLLPRGRRNQQAGDSETLFDRKIRCQQIAQQLQREQAKEYDYLEYEDIEWAS